MFRLRYDTVMFWRRKRKVLTVSRPSRTVAPEQPGPWDRYFKGQHDAMANADRNRAFRAQNIWPNKPWPTATEDERETLLLAQMSIDERYVEAHPMKTYKNLCLLRTAAETSGIPLSEVVTYLDAFHDVSASISFIENGIPLEYAVALMEEE